jgi:hypothetical protein
MLLYNGNRELITPPSSPEVKNGGAIPPLPHTYSRRGAQFIKARDALPLPFHNVTARTCIIIPISYAG